MIILLIFLSLLYSLKNYIRFEKMNLCFKCFLVASSIIAHSLVGILQQVCHNILISQKLSKNSEGNYEYSTITVIAYSEVFYYYIYLSQFIKFSITSLLSLNTTRVQVSWLDYFLWCVPALIYAFGNNVQFIVMKKLNSPVSALIFGSTEIIHVGIASMIVLHKKYTINIFNSITQIKCSSMVFIFSIMYRSSKL